jgi:hypothetical protein
MTGGARHVPHRVLRRSDLPAGRAPFEEIVTFAYTFDGYAHYGMEHCGTLANETYATWTQAQTLPDDLDALRACLFFEARRWIVLEREPDIRARLYVDALLEAIGDAVEACAEGAEALPLARD